MDNIKKTTLNPYILIAAYSQGYFPMPDEDSGGMLWFKPDPRAIIPLDGFHVSRSLKRTINKGHFTVTFDQAFQQVMNLCADRDETWINDEIKTSYEQLYHLGHAHSVEVWLNEKDLVGGVYGVSLRSAFFAESMFHKVTDASKAALYCLVNHLAGCGFTLLECQFMTDHLRTLGAKAISDRDYMDHLKTALKNDAYFQAQSESRLITVPYHKDR